MVKRIFPLVFCIIRVSIVISQTLPFELKFEGEPQSFFASDLREIYHRIRQNDQNNRSWTILIQGNATRDATKDHVNFCDDSSWFASPMNDDVTPTFTIMGYTTDLSKMPVMDGENNAPILWRFSGCKNLVIKNLHFKRFTQAGVQFSQCDRCRIANCLFSEVTDPRGCAGIFLDQSSHCIVDSCVFERFIGPQDSPAVHAVYLDNLSKHNLIQNNIVKDCSGSAFKVRNGSDENEFLYNIIEKCAGLSFLESGIEDSTEIESRGNRVDWNICLSPDDATVSSREVNSGKQYSKNWEMDYQSSPLIPASADSFYMKTENPVIAEQPAQFEFSMPLYKATAEFQENVAAHIIPKYYTKACTYVSGFDVIFDTDAPQKINSPFLIKTFEGEIIRTYFLEKWIVTTGSDVKSYSVRGTGEWIQFIVMGKSPLIKTDLYLDNEKISSAQKESQNVVKMQCLLKEQKLYEVRVNPSTSDSYQLIAKPLAGQQP